MKKTIVMLVAVFTGLLFGQSVGALPVGSCGNPGGIASDPLDKITATDALYILRAASTANRPDPEGCITLICDVTGDGKITATDALWVMRESVGFSHPPFNCPTTIDSNTCPPENCPCTAEGIIDLFESISGDGKKMPTQGIAMMMRCNELVSPAPTASNPLKIKLEDSPTKWNNGINKITRDNLLFDMAGQHVEFRLDPYCSSRCLGTCIDGVHANGDCTQNSECQKFCQGTNPAVRCAIDSNCDVQPECVSGACENVTPTETCQNNNDCAVIPGTCLQATCSEPIIASCGSGCSGNCSNTTCPDVDAGGAVFLRIQADNVYVDGGDGPDGPTVRGFFDGIVFESKTIINAQGEEEEDITKNGTIRNVTMNRQCDDSISTSGSIGVEVLGGTIKRGCDKCAQLGDGGPIIDSQLCGGRDCYHAAFYDVDFEGCAKPLRSTAATRRFLVHGGTHKPITNWPCSTSDFGGTGLEVTVSDVTAKDCISGLEFGNGNHIVTCSKIQDNSERGILTKGGGAVWIEKTKIIDNGGSPGGNPTGGVAAKDSSTLNLGDGPLVGHNSIYGNQNGQQSSRQIGNHVDDLAIQAQYNWLGQFPPPAPGPNSELYISPNASNADIITTDSSGTETSLTSETITGCD